MLQDSRTEENKMDRLKGKIALITGGTSGIGAATAKLFQEVGATVIVTGASENSVKAARQAMPCIEVVHSNAGDTQATEKLVQSVAQKHGKIDVLFVNAGIARVAAAADTEERVFDELFATNVRGPYFLLKHAIPVLSDGASVILTSSTSALRAVPGLSAYSASKAALRTLGITLAVELAPPEDPGEYHHSRADQYTHRREDGFDAGTDGGLRRVDRECAAEAARKSR
jgi:NAD(P)-dependent dehydrogenase (short-subunit alcohol dehydrogenase family)